MITLLLTLALCGPATYTADQPVTVGVQLGEGYEEVALEAGETVEYWEAAPGRSWAVWDLETGEVLAQGVKCGEPVTVEDPAQDVELIPPLVVANPVLREAPALPVGVRPV